MGPHWLRWVVLGTVTCLMAVVVALVVVGAVSGSPGGHAAVRTTIRRGAAAVPTALAGGTARSSSTTPSASTPSNSNDLTTAPPLPSVPTTATPAGATSPEPGTSPEAVTTGTAAPSQPTTAGPTLTYRATAPTGSSLVYLDPNRGEVQQANVGNWTKSWIVTPGLQSDAAIVVTASTPVTAVTCSISWHGGVVANQSGTGQADCQYLVSPPGA